MNTAHSLRLGVIFVFLVAFAGCQFSPQTFDASPEPSQKEPVEEKKPDDKLPDEPSSTCGNGILEPSEECDDGNKLNFDGCTSACKLELGWENCPPLEGKRFNCVRPKCGDGIVIKGREECDDGNTVGADGCSPTCKVEPGATCPDFVSGNKLYIPVVARLFEKDPVADFGCFLRGQISEELDPQGRIPQVDPSCPEYDAEKNRFLQLFLSSTQPITYNYYIWELNASTKWGVSASMAELGENPSEYEVRPFDFLMADDTQAVRNPYKFTKNFTGVVRMFFKFTEDINIMFGTSNDLLVYVNNKLATKIFQGKYSESLLSIPIGETNKFGGKRGNETFGMVEGQYYEMALFYIGRGETPILRFGFPSGFAGPSFCYKCGDYRNYSSVANVQECDLGPEGGDGCTSDCRIKAGWICHRTYDGKTACRQSKCGDGVKLGGEECDDGNSDSGDGCSSSCRIEKGYTCDVYYEQSICTKQP